MPQTGAETWPNHHLSSFVDAAGLTWHIHRSGEGPKILLVHGIAASTHSWRGIIPILAKHYSVLAVDLPGHGQSSELPATQCSIAGYGNVLTGLLGKLNFDPAFVVGHSAGAVILCNMALSHQINPRVIVSINGAFLPLMGNAYSLIKRLAARPVLHRVLARRAFNIKNVARVIESTGSHLDEDSVELYARLLQHPSHVMNALRMVSEWDLKTFMAQLPLITQPLALLVASEDRAVPLNDVFEVMQHVRAATLYPLHDLGHLAHEEDPQLVGQRILEIVSGYVEKSVA